MYASLIRTSPVVTSMEHPQTREANLPSGPLLLGKHRPLGIFISTLTPLSLYAIVILQKPEEILRGYLSKERGKKIP